jgi:hypothetical protein
MAESAGVVSKEGRPVKRATVRFSALERKYTTVTDNEGRSQFGLLRLGKYSFTVLRDS